MDSTQRREMRQLSAARTLGRNRPVTIRTTFLGAHALPPEAQGDKDRYIGLVCEEMLPAVAEAGLADAVDGFMESIAFSGEQIASGILRGKARSACRSSCMPTSFPISAARRLPRNSRALSADHLEHTDAAGVAAMARAGTVAVLLPGAFYFIRETNKPPVELLREHRVNDRARDRLQSRHFAAHLVAARDEHGRNPVPA